MEGKHVELSGKFAVDDNDEINGCITLKGNTVDLAEAWIHMGIEIANRLGVSYEDLVLSSYLFTTGNGPDHLERVVVNMKAFDFRPEQTEHDDHDQN